MCKNDCIAVHLRFAKGGQQHLGLQSFIPAVTATKIERNFLVIASQSNCHSMPVHLIS